MRSLELLLLLPALGVAALPNPLHERTYATPSTSTGFRLIAKLTDPSADLSPSINNWAVSSAHTGAGLSAGVLSSNTSRLFYQNGTAAEVTARQTNLITDGATPPAPFGIGLQGPAEFDGPVYPTEHRVSVDVGPGTRALAVEVNGKGWPVVVVGGQGEGGRWMACNRSIWYYYGEEWMFIVVRYVYAGEETPSEECVGVELVAQCDVLNELPADAYASHEYAAAVQCLTGEQVAALG